MDTIASCAFGMDAQSFGDRETESEFVKHAKNMFRFSKWELFRIMFIMLVPLMDKLCKLLK